jgi:hypothetical protein
MSSPDESISKGDSCPGLSLMVDGGGISRFFPLLQTGVMVRAAVGCSVTTFLKKEMGTSPETIDKIQSIFLDGRPIDDLETSVVRDGSVLALSAALPGLVGATLRRGGAYSSFRSGITYHETGAACAAGDGFVQVKLFNLVMEELGPELLKKGVFVTPSLLTEFLKGQSEDFWLGCREVLLDGKPVDTEDLGNITFDIAVGQSISFGYDGG